MRGLNVGSAALAFRRVLRNEKRHRRLERDKAARERHSARSNTAANRFRARLTPSNQCARATIDTNNTAKSKACGQGANLKLLHLLREGLEAAAEHHARRQQEPPVCVRQITHHDQEL